MTAASIRLVEPICLMINIFMVSAIYATDIQLVINDNKRVSVPIDILKEVGTIYNNVADVGSHGEVIGSVSNQQKMPVQISSIECVEVFDAISALKVLMHAEAIRTKKAVIKNFHTDQADEEMRKHAINEMSSWPTWQEKPPAQLIRIIQGANFLDVKPVVDLAIKVFAKTGSKNASRFHETDDDVKTLIIKEQSQEDFMALIKVNQNADALEEERSFKIALNIHYEEIELKDGFTAKARYEELFNSVLGRFISIPAGTYTIGSPAAEANRSNDENLHSIDLNQFEIMPAAVTQEAYARLTGQNPSVIKGKQYCPKSYKKIEVNGVNISVCADHPVEMVNHDDALKFVELMNERDLNHKYRLPTEAELEVAFRGEAATAYFFGDDEQGVSPYVWHAGNSNNQTHGVRTKLANRYGVYRSSVWEWTTDWYEANYASSTGLDPKGPTSGSRLVIRGGGWKSDASSCRSAYRRGNWPYGRFGDVGFRLVRT